VLAASGRAINVNAFGKRCDRMPSRPSSRKCRNGSSAIGPLRQKVGRVRSCGGFTMMELIVVVIMVGVVAVTVGMNYGPFASRAHLRTAVDQVAGDLRFLQAKAMASLSSASVSFPTGRNTYDLGGRVKALPSGVTISSGLTVTFNSLGEYPYDSNAILTLSSGSLTGSIKIYAISGDVEAY
jgi:prepilin-type N-terminal cleavage/methylation domain-containing protein